MTTFEHWKEGFLFQARGNPSSLGAKNNRRLTILNVMNVGIKMLSFDPSTSEGDHVVSDPRKSF